MEGKMDITLTGSTHLVHGDRAATAHNGVVDAESVQRLETNTTHAVRVRIGGQRSDAGTNGFLGRVVGLLLAQPTALVLPDTKHPAQHTCYEGAQQQMAKGGGRAPTPPPTHTLAPTKSSSPSTARYLQRRARCSTVLRQLARASGGKCR